MGKDSFPRDTGREIDFRGILLVQINVCKENLAKVNIEIENLEDGKRMMPKIWYVVGILVISALAFQLQYFGGIQNITGEIVWANITMIGIPGLFSLLFSSPPKQELEMLYNRRKNLETRIANLKAKLIA